MNGVLVTGATTPLGIELICELIADEAVDSVLAVGAERADRTPRLPPTDKLRYLARDLTRARDIRDLLFSEARELGVRTIVHAAHHRATDEGKKVHRLNVESTRLLLELAERHPTIERFVFRSHADVYQVDHDQPTFIEETHPLRIAARMPQWVRDRVEADVTVCMRMGMSELSIAVLRCSEVFAPNVGSQLHDYLQSRVCFRPLGFDPMLQLMAPKDAVTALHLAVTGDAEGVFNIPGKDVLPLSRAIEEAGRRAVAVPGPLLTPLYGARRFALGTQFRYGLNAWRFHFGGILDGRRAEEVLGYEPSHWVSWEG